MYIANIENRNYTVEFEKQSTEKGKLNGNPFQIDINFNDTGFHLIKGADAYRIEIVSLNADEKIIHLKINGNLHRVTLKDETDVLLKNMGLSNGPGKTISDVKAPMPGLVTKILVKEGDTVKKDDILLVLEAMKMENNIKSQIDGEIKKIHCTAGKPVEKNEVLILFE